MKIHAHSLRVLHKWIGLIIGLQFLLWAVSGAVMAFLPMEDVAGGVRPQPPKVVSAAADGWPAVQAQLRGTAVDGLSLRPLLAEQVFEVRTRAGIKLFEAETGRLIRVDRTLAKQIAGSAYAGPGKVATVTSLDALTLPVRGHELPIWRVEFSDSQNSSVYVSGSTGAILERRNDSWRVWDFFWMLHNMDYVNRTSFNHPMIVIVGFAAVWLAVTGVWLLLRTGWRSDFKRLRRS